MEKMKFLITGLLALTVLSAPLLASEGKGFDKRMNLEELNLTPEQKDQVKKIREESKPTMDEKHKAMQAAREEMTKAMQEGASDGKLRELHSKITLLRTEMNSMRFDKMLAVRGVLTPEQRKKFRYMHDEMGNNPAKMMEKGKSGGKKKEAKTFTPEPVGGY